MNDIFASIYNKVLGFFKPTEKEENAKDIACNRLRVVLMQDRTNLTPELMERMRNELIELLSRYVEMDKEALELNFGQEGDQMALMLSIPVLRAKDEEEIEKTLAEIDSKKTDEESKNIETEPTNVEEAVVEKEVEVEEEVEETAEIDNETKSKTKADVASEIKKTKPKLNKEENLDCDNTDKIEIIEEVTPKEQKIAELSVEDIVEPPKNGNTSNT